VLRGTDALIDGVLDANNQQPLQNIPLGAKPRGLSGFTVAATTRRQ